jgi:integrase/recombinase XerD
MARQHQARVLTKEELKRVLAICDSMTHGRRNRMIMELSHFAGLRAIELAGLTIGDMFENGRVKEKILLDKHQTKGNKKGRAVYLNKRLRKAISEYITTPNDSIYMRPELPFFRSQKGSGGAFSPNTMSKLFREIYDLAGLPDAKSHSGRRYFITNLAKKGTSAPILKELAGHSSMNTTQRYIDEIGDDVLQAAVEGV